MQISNMYTEEYSAYLLVPSLFAYAVRCHGSVAVINNFRLCEPRATTMTHVHVLGTFTYFFDFMFIFKSHKRLFLCVPYTRIHMRADLHLFQFDIFIWLDGWMCVSWTRLRMRCEQAVVRDSRLMYIKMVGQVAYWARVSVYNTAKIGAGSW